MSVKKLAESRKDMLLVDYHNLDVMPEFNKRQDYGDIKELAENILQNGILTPLVCKRNPDNKEHYHIIQGHRRHAACKYLFDHGKIKELRVPIILKARETSDVDLYVDMISANEGKPLTVLEQAEVIGQLLKLNLEEKEIAQRLAKPLIFVQNCQTLLSAPVSVKKTIKENKISSTLVIEMFRKEKKFDHVVEMINDMNASVHVNGNGSAKGKITKKAVMKKAETVNSALIFRKLNKKHKDLEINPAKMELWKFLDRFVAGKVKEKEMYELFYKHDD